MKTIFFDRHLALGAKMVPFAGWEMPLHYSKGILYEHQAVRQRVGLFDVSHMGRIAIEGLEAEKFIEYLSTNGIEGKADRSITYTIFTNAQGGSIDDLLVYKKDRHHFFVVVNASNRQKDLLHIQEKAVDFQVAISDHFSDEAILALQGPATPSLVARLLPELSTIAPHYFLETTFQGNFLIVAASGYTGEKGYEFFAAADTLAKLWDQLISEGAEPVGLGARDTLRLEKGYALYGHELSDSIAPTESVAAWAVKWNKGDFLGKKALEALEKSPSKRHAYGVRLQGKGIAREGYPVYKEERQIGRVTSGTFSPSLSRAIALILVHETLSKGDRIAIQIRDQRVSAEVVGLPFF